jgi:hypothetical protein
MRPVRQPRVRRPRWAAWRLARLAAGAAAQEQRSARSEEKRLDERAQRAPGVGRGKMRRVGLRGRTAPAARPFPWHAPGDRRQGTCNRLVRSGRRDVPAEDRAVAQARSSAHVVTGLARPVFARFRVRTGATRIGFQAALDRRLPRPAHRPRQAQVGTGQHEGHQEMNYRCAGCSHPTRPKRGSGVNRVSLSYHEPRSRARRTWNNEPGADP